MGKSLKNFKIPFIGITILLSIIIRLLYAFYSPQPLISPDTFGYYQAGQEMIKTGVLVHHSRPPVYPLFHMISPDFNTAAHLAVFLQTIMGITGLYLLHRILIAIKISPKWSALFVLFIGLNPNLFVQERVILTESLAVFFLILLTYSIVKLINKFSVQCYLLIVLCFILLLFLKPLYLALPLIMIPLLFIFKRSKQLFLWSSLSFLLILLLVFLYIQTNSKYHGYPGFSRIGDIDLLGQILYFNLNIEKGKEVSYFYDMIKDYRKTGGDPMPFRFLEHYDPEIYNKPERFRELAKFNRLVIMDNLTPFFSGILQLIPKALISTNDLYSYAPKTDNRVLKTVFDSLFYFYSLTQYLNFLLFPAVIIYIVFRLIKNPKYVILNTKYEIIISSIPLFHLFLTIPFVYYDFGRLLSPSLPQLYLAIFLFISPVISSKSQQSKPQ